MTEHERERQLDRLLLLTERVLIALVKFLEHQSQPPAVYPKTIGIRVELTPD